ncbi:uncharacterized protein LOC113238898 [Hyposmocoma kahamanoa]|uniref:uncharacterized protein LOC113238898 n=1 Tax=Hyposmocoma kahamanoa TaxID=1477025 RepID=UPI000E6D9108|nr:uncharacterized protein LOC113238898 [Hyposmocoma kahamanoa]
MYTDASKLAADGCVGAAVWIPKYEIILNCKCPSQASIFTGESTALLEALSYVESHKLNKSIIFSDSKSCLQAILANQFVSKSKFHNILKIKEVLYQCHSNNIQVVLAWIPGHSGIQGNETVDILAKNAIQTGCLNHYRTYTYDLLPLATNDMFSSWSNEWNKIKLIKGKYYADIQISIPKKPWFSNLKGFSKSVTSTICRLRLGHACTPVHLAKLRIRDNSICECGLDEELE